MNQQTITSSADAVLLAIYRARLGEDLSAELSSYGLETLPTLPPLVCGCISSGQFGPPGVPAAWLAGNGAFLIEQRDTIGCREALVGALLASCSLAWGRSSDGACRSEMCLLLVYFLLRSGWDQELWTASQMLIVNLFRTMNHLSNPLPPITALSLLAAAQTEMHIDSFMHESAKGLANLSDPSGRRDSTIQRVELLLNVSAMATLKRTLPLMHMDKLMRETLPCFYDELQKEPVWLNEAAARAAVLLEQVQKRVRMDSGDHDGPPTCPLTPSPS